MERVLIEFFDRENLNNCISQLHEPFDRIVYLYFEGDRCPRTESLFKALADFNKVRAGITPAFFEIERNNVDQIIRKLSELVNPEDRFVFDITGGPELFVMASGLFYDDHPEADMVIQMYDVVSGKRIVSYPRKTDDAQKEYVLSVNEIVRLHGCAVAQGVTGYNLAEKELESNILRLWNTVRGHTFIWNRFCCLVNFKKVCPDGTVFYKKTSNRAETEIFNEITGALVKKKLISIMPSKKIDGVNYSAFISKMPLNTDMLFEKGGNLLEMLTYLAVKKADKNADVMVGVPVDWDGIITGETWETKNEIDLIVSDGKIPIFISCKNTEVTNNYLYELKSMSMHYGGLYTKCVLVSTAENTAGIHNRAKSMDIRLIDDIAGLKPEKYFEIIKKACFS